MNKLKAALVESFVGTVALGWMFALAIEHFANAFAAPWGCGSREGYSQADCDPLPI